MESALLLRSHASWYLGLELGACLCCGLPPVSGSGQLSTVWRWAGDTLGPESELRCLWLEPGVALLADADTQSASLTHQGLCWFPLPFGSVLSCSCSGVWAIPLPV